MGIHRLRSLKLVIVLTFLLLSTVTPVTAQPPPPFTDNPVRIAPLSPGDYPPDPTANISWSGGTSGVADIQGAFNNARTEENTQVSTSTPMMTLPSQGEWDAMNDGEKALWLINRERVDRGVEPLHGLEVNVTDVAQTYAQYLLDNDTWGHDADGWSPWDRLNASSVISVCHDFLNVAENLAVFVTSGSSIALPVERSIYDWMYNDGSSWGHRHAILWYPYDDNSGPSGQEGFLGIGRANGGPYKGPFDDSWNYAELIVMNVFDPCPTWDYGAVAPNAPTDLAVTLTSQTAITLTWTDNSDDEDGFEIERSPDGSDGWLQVGTVMTDVTTHTDTGLTCETPYYYRTRAFNMGGNSEYSNVVSDTTAACPAAPALTVVKSVDTGGLDPVPLGSVITYTITVRNGGTAIASNVVLTDPLPAAINNVEWLNQGTATLVMHTIRWGPYDVGVGEAYTFTFRTTVRDETMYIGENVVNTAYASADNALPTSGSASFTIYGDTFHVYLPLVLHGWPPTYSVSGNITDDQSEALAGVTVVDDIGHTATSDANGDYTLSGLYAGSYILTPSKAGYTFAPVTTTVSVPPEATGVNFVGTPTASPLQRLIVFEAFLRPACGFCQTAAQVIRDQLVPEYADKAVLFLEYDIDDDAYDPRQARWWDGYQIGGMVTTPLVMTDSGDQVATGDVYFAEGFYAAFKAMIDTALAIPEGQAEVSTTAQRSGNRVAASVQVTNRGAITLGTGNKATVWLVVYEEFDDAPVTDRLTRRYVRATASQAIATDLAPDASAAFNLETADLSGVNWDRLRAVVVVDYRPNPAARPYDTYQAISVPVTP